MIDHQWEDHGLLRRFRGIVSLNQVGRSDKEIQAHPLFDGMRYLVDDFLDCVNVVDLDPGLLSELAAIAAVAVRNPGYFRHAVVSRLPAVREMAAAFVNSGFGTYPVRHFERLADARRWVGE